MILLFSVLFVEDCSINQTTFWTCFFACRNLDKEVSFDFGPNAEFAYLYSQCYELTTSEYVHTLVAFLNYHLI